MACLLCPLRRLKIKYVVCSLKGHVNIYSKTLPKADLLYLSNGAVPGLPEAGLKVSGGQLMLIARSARFSKTQSHFHYKSTIRLENPGHFCKHEIQIEGMVEGVRKNVIHALIREHGPVEIAFQDIFSTVSRFQVYPHSECATVQERFHFCSYTSSETKNGAAANVRTARSKSFRQGPAILTITIIYPVPYIGQLCHLV